MASYTDWSDMVRQPLLWLGEPDPAHSVFESMSEDPDREQLGRLMRTWLAIFGSAPTMVRDVVKASQAFAAGEHHVELHEIVTEIAGGHGAVNRGRFGWWIKRHSGRIVDGLRIDKVPGKRNADQWQVKSMVSGLSVLSGVSTATEKSVTPVEAIHKPSSDAVISLPPMSEDDLSHHVSHTASKLRLEDDAKPATLLH